VVERCPPRGVSPTKLDRVGARGGSYLKPRAQTTAHRDDLRRLRKDKRELRMDHNVPERAAAILETDLHIHLAQHGQVPLCAAVRLC
jgi:hypothetical protein